MNIFFKYIEVSIYTFEVRVTLYNLLFESLVSFHSVICKKYKINKTLPVFVPVDKMEQHPHVPISCCYYKHINNFVL